MAPACCDVLRLTTMTNYHKILRYWLFGLLLSALACINTGAGWSSSAAFHTLMEVIATMLALIVGAMSLIRHYSHGESKYLLVGVGFVGTALFDGFHAVITSIWFHATFPSDLDALIPWSWFASRFFLSVMLMLSVLPWLPGRFFAKLVRVSDRAIY